MGEQDALICIHKLLQRWTITEIITFHEYAGMGAFEQLLSGHECYCNEYDGAIGKYCFNRVASVVIINLN